MKKIAVFIMCFISANLYAQQPQAIDYIKQNAIALNVTDSNTGFDDLIPLKATLSNRRIIGMGEATHGTHEFQATKIRMFKFLVEEMGYKLFGIEANFTECRKLNDYVLTGKGDVRKALDGTYFWVWNTKDILEMIEWMRSYNANKPDSVKIKFYGFDMQVERVAIDMTVHKLKKLDSDYYEAHFSALKNLKMVNRVNGKYLNLSIEKADSIKQLLANIATYLNAHDAELISMFDKEKTAYLKHDVRMLQQCFDESLVIDNMIEAGKLRAKYMAENIEWILNYEGPESKIMLCAHNGHISKEDMGSYLKKDYKDQYYAIGFDFNEGGFRARDMNAANKALTNFKVDDAQPGSSGKIFSKLNTPAFFIDIEKVIKTESPAGLFFTKGIWQRNIGSGFSVAKEKLYYSEEPIYSKFDGLIFINYTTPTIGP